jgi:hypothetical protein
MLHEEDHVVRGRVMKSGPFCALVLAALIPSAVIPGRGLRTPSARRLAAR